MSCNQTPTFNDEQKMTDLLCSEKYMTEVYNTFCCETATPTVRSCLCSLLQDSHRIQEEIFHEMSSRGWYPVDSAEDSKIHSARMKFEKNVTV